MLQYLGGNKIASGSGLLTAIQRQPAILFQLDEFGMFLSAAADRKRSPRYVCEILDLMTELYTTSGTTYFGIEYASNQLNNAHRAIHQPCACIYGTTTPIHFWQALQASNVADGSLARFLILESEDDSPDSNELFGTIDPPQDLIDRLLLIHQSGGQLSGNLTDVGAIDEVLVESNYKRALQILRDGEAAGMSKSEFTRRTQFMDHRQRDGVLRTLTDAHLVEVFAKPTGGRPSQWIKLAGADE